MVNEGNCAVIENSCQIGTKGEWGSIWEGHKDVRNTVPHPEGPFLVAGRYQYRSMWARDFAQASLGLLTIREHELVARQILALVTRKNEEGLIPKGLDTRPLEKRVVSATIRGILGVTRKIPFTGDSLIALHKDFLGSAAIDSNLLILNAAIQHSVYPGSQINLLVEHFTEMKAIFDYYHNHIQDGLIWQPKFSDWQDSVMREGHTFLTNLIYFKVCEGLLRYPNYGITQEFVETLKAKIMNTFFDSSSGLFISVSGRENISLDGNLFAIDWGFLNIDGCKRLYDSLRASVLWHNKSAIPGNATYPNYPANEKAPQIRIALMHGYHDSYIWTWLTALCAKISYRMGDMKEGDRIASALAYLIKRDSTIFETYQQEPEMRPVETWMYNDEVDISEKSNMSRSFVVFVISALSLT